MSKDSVGGVAMYKDFADLIVTTGHKFGDRTAVSWYGRKQTEYKKTFCEFRDDIYALINAFRGMGLDGKHIAVTGENCYEWLVVYMAAAACGGVAVCIDFEQSEESILQMVKQADAEALFISVSAVDIGHRCIRGNSAVKELFVLERKDGNSVISVSELIEHHREDGFPRGEAFSAKHGEAYADDVLPPIDEKQTAAIVYTSGTTGISKPVMLSHRAILTNAGECNIYVNGGPVAFSALPFCHTYGMTCGALATWARGGKLILNGSLKTVMRDLQQSDAYSILTVPLMVEAIYDRIWLNAQRTGKADKLKALFRIAKIKRRLGIKTVHPALEDIRKKCVGDLKVIICGGAHMDREIAEYFELMGLTVLQGYGITECAPLVAVNGNSDNRLGSVGRVLPSCRISLDGDEILVTGVNIMNGYYGMPEETEEAMDGEWFRTGDIGRIDKDGYLYITGRKKNLIVFKNGKKLSPEMLEEKLRQVNLVKDVLVYGAVSGVSADDVKIAASIYPDPGRTKGMSSYEILEGLQSEVDEINSTLPLCQQIQMINIRDEEFDKTSMMKIKRHLV